MWLIQNLNSQLSNISLGQQWARPRSQLMMPREVQRIWVFYIIWHKHTFLSINCSRKKLHLWCTHQFFSLWILQAKLPEGFVKMNVSTGNDQVLVFVSTLFSFEYLQNYLPLPHHHEFKQTKVLTKWPVKLFPFKPHTIEVSHLSLQSSESKEELCFASGLPLQQSHRSKCYQTPFFPRYRALPMGRGVRLSAVTLR